MEILITIVAICTIEALSFLSFIPEVDPYGREDAE